MGAQLRRWLAQLLACVGGCLLVTAVTIKPDIEDEHERK
jgi:hypothetical protein